MKKEAVEIGGVYWLASSSWNGPSRSVTVLSDRGDGYFDAEGFMWRYEDDPVRVRPRDLTAYSDSAKAQEQRMLEQVGATNRLLATLRRTLPEATQAGYGPSLADAPLGMQDTRFSVVAGATSPDEIQVSLPIGLLKGVVETAYGGIHFERAYLLAAAGIGPDEAREHDLGSPERISNADLAAMAAVQAGAVI